MTHPDVASVRSALDGWGVTTVVLPDPAGLAPYARVHPVRSIAVLMTAVTGRAPTYQAGAWVWSDVDHAGPPLVRTAGQLAACITGDPHGSGGIDRHVDRLRPGASRRRLTDRIPPCPGGPGPGR